MVYVVTGTHFHAPRACGAREAKNFPANVFFFAETVPTSYRTPASVHGVPNSSEYYTYYNIDTVFGGVFVERVQLLEINI